MSWRTSIFGLSQADRAEEAAARTLAVLAADRESQAAIFVRLLDVLTVQAEAQRAQADVAKRQFDLMTADYGRPTEVRMRTPAEEARLELNRAKNIGEIGATQDVSALLREFAADPRFFAVEGAPV